MIWFRATSRSPRGSLHMRQELSPFAPQRHAASQEVARRPPLSGVNVRLRDQASTGQHGDLVGVDRSMLGLAAMDGPHVQGVAQGERNVLAGKKVSESGPRCRGLPRSRRDPAGRGQSPSEMVRGPLSHAGDFGSRRPGSGRRGPWCWRTGRSCRNIGVVGNRLRSPPLRVSFSPSRHTTVVGGGGAPISINSFKPTPLSGVA
jgi:hypothetical protein